MVQSAGYRFYLGYKYLWCYPDFALQDVYTSCLSCSTWECSTCLHDYRFCLKEHYAKKLSLLREVYVSKTFTAWGQAMLREIVLWKYVFEVYIGPEGKEQVNDVEGEWEQQQKKPNSIKENVPNLSILHNLRKIECANIIVNKWGTLKIIILYKSRCLFSRKKNEERWHFLPANLSVIFEKVTGRDFFFSCSKPTEGFYLNCVRICLYTHPLS